jgi:hypothetical protein
MLFRLTEPVFFVFRAIARMRNDRLSFSIRLSIPTLGLFVTKAGPDLAILSLLRFLSSADQEVRLLLVITMPT